MHVGHILGSKIQGFKTRLEKGNVMSLPCFIWCYTCKQVLVKKEQK